MNEWMDPLERLNSQLETLSRQPLHWPDQKAALHSALHQLFQILKSFSQDFKLSQTQLNSVMNHSIRDVLSLNAVCLFDDFKSLTRLFRLWKSN